MNCSDCSHENRDGARFCEACGAGLATSCPSCGSESGPGAKFCGECGTSLEPHASPDEPATAGPAVLEGERKQVTVLFSDIRGSMDLAGSLGAERWHRIIDRFFSIVTAGVQRFEGTVNQFTGDGIMALFGAPLAQEDHAHRACYAALHLVDELQQFGEELHRDKGIEFRTRMGINSGEIVIGAIGSGLRIDNTALGHAVGIAARLESLADPDHPLVSQSTARLVEGFFELESRGEYELKGVPGQSRVFALQGVGSARTRFDLARRRGLARLVGRDDELGFLESSLDRSRSGPGGVVGIVAPAGTGKSHLCTAFIERCRKRGLRVFEARGLAHGRHVPLLPMIELFRAFFDIKEHDDDVTARLRVEERLLPFDEKLRDELPVLYQFLGILEAGAPAPESDPEAYRERLFTVVRALVHLDGAADASVLLVEDLHWLDAASNALLSEIVKTQAHAPGFILLNFRPEYEPPWLGQSFYQQLALQPLVEEAIATMVENRVGGDPSVSGLAHLVFERSRGNPFFAEEILRELVETEVLVGAPGSHRAAAPIERLDVPETVQATLNARIDRLGEQAKALLQTASVVGKTFPERVLRDLVGSDGSKLADRLRQLVDSEFLILETLYPETEYAFKHPLTQEVAYGTQLRERREATHAAVARTLERLHGERLDEVAALLAHHWEYADLPLDAARWHARAGEWVGANDYRQAYEHWERVALLTEGTDRDPKLDAATRRQVQELRARSAHRRLDTGFREGTDIDLLEPIYEEGRRYLEQLGDFARSASTAVAFAQVVQSSRGDIRRYHGTVLEAVRLAALCDDPIVQAVADVESGWSHLVSGNLRESVAACERGIQRIGGRVEEGAYVAGYNPYALGRGFWLYARALLGQRTNAVPCIEDFLAVAHDHSPPETLAWLHGFATFYWEAVGDAERALEAATRSRETADGAGAVHALVCSHAWMGIALCLARRWDEAEQQLLHAQSLCREKNAARDFEPQMTAYLAEARIHTRGAEEALHTAEEALEISDRGNAVLFGSRALLAHARALRQIPSADPHQVHEAIERGENRAREIGALSFVPHFRVERALLARDEGDLDCYESELAAAVAAWREAGAQGWIAIAQG